MLARRKRKKRFDSSWNKLSPICPQIFDKVNSLGSKNHEIQKWPFSWKLFFANNLWTKRARTKQMIPSCFSRQFGSNHILDNLERSCSKFDLRSRSRGDPIWPRWVKFHMSRCVLTRQTHWRHFQFSIFTLSKVIGKKPLWPRCDLRWPCGRSLDNNCTWVIKNSFIWHDLEKIGVIWYVFLK